MNGGKPKRYIVDYENLPKNFPTHRHTSEFWEALGRAVATFGFLEEVLGKAIFAFTATREFSEDEIQVEYERWLPTLERVLSDPLGSLIAAYGKAVRENKAATITTLVDLLETLREASVVRNVLCHGSWRAPDEQGHCVPFFVDKKGRVFETTIGISYLNQVQQHVAELACNVIGTVTHMGWQFPGSSGPGNPIFRRS